MTSDLDPAREAAVRRRLASFGDAIAVPTAADGPGDDLNDATGTTDLALVREGPDRHGPSRRPLVLAAAAATVVVAGAAGALTLTGGDDDDTEAATASTATTSAAGLGSCGPRVAEDGVIASGPTQGGGSWEVRVSGAPPHVATNVIVDGASTSGLMHDEMSRPALVNAGHFSLGVDLNHEDSIVYGEVPRETAVVEITTDDGGVLSACPVTAPTDDLIAWFGLSLPAGTQPTGARALDPAGQVLASGDLSWEPHPGIPDAEPGAIGTAMTADPALVDLPLGGTEMALPPPVERTEIASGTAGGTAWRLRAALDSDRADIEMEYEGGASTLQSGPRPLAEGTHWSLDAAGDELIAWGPVPADVRTVTVTLADGTSVDLATVTALADGSVRAFAGTLPARATPTAIEAHRADGSVALQAVDLAEDVAALARGDIGGAGFSAEPLG